MDLNYYLENFKHYKFVQSYSGVPNKRLQSVQYTPYTKHDLNLLVKQFCKTFCCAKHHF